MRDLFFNLLTSRYFLFNIQDHYQLYKSQRWSTEKKWKMVEAKSLSTQRLWCSCSVWWRGSHCLHRWFLDQLCRLLDPKIQYGTALSHAPILSHMTCDGLFFWQAKYFYICLFCHLGCSYILLSPVLNYPKLPLTAWQLLYTVNYIYYRVHLSKTENET